MTPHPPKSATSFPSKTARPACTTAGPLSKECRTWATSGPPSPSTSSPAGSSSAASASPWCATSRTSTTKSCQVRAVLRAGLGCRALGAPGRGVVGPGLPLRAGIRERLRHPRRPTAHLRAPCHRPHPGNARAHPAPHRPRPRLPRTGRLRRRLLRRALLEQVRLADAAEYR
jgi:hypothetical protein